MNVIVIEDEKPAARRLSRLLAELNLKVSVMLHSVEEAVHWFEVNEHPDLIFLDIQLSDGLSFEIFEKVEVKSAIIFTTAYNEYAIRGFKYNSIDYLLKPIDKKDLSNAIAKLKNSPYIAKTEEPDNLQDFKNIFQKVYKHRFIVKVGNHFSTFKVNDICYFKSQEGMVWICTAQGKEYPIEYSLDQLEEILNPFAVTILFKTL